MATGVKEFKNQKELYNDLKTYLDKDDIKSVVKEYKSLLKQIFNKRINKYKVGGAIEEEEKITKPIQVMRQPHGPGGLFGTYPGADLHSKVYNIKTISPENDNDTAKIGFNFILGPRIGGRVTVGEKKNFTLSVRKKYWYAFIKSEFMKEITPTIPRIKKSALKDLKSKIGAIRVEARKAAAVAALIGTLGTGMAVMGIYDQAKIFGLKPEVIIGTVPLYSVQMIERAKSDRKLKNRALGDVFLAHQKGNKDILRIDCTLSGPLRFFYLYFLVQLQKEGEAKQKNISASKEAKQYVETAGAGAWEGIPTDKKVLNYDVHKTFPVITRNSILFSMYLQTIEWHQSVEEGMEIIKVHLLFRKYFPTTAFKVFNPITDDEGNFIGGSGLEVGESYGMARRWLEFTVDAIWKMNQLYGEWHGRMLVGDDGQTRHIIDRQAVSSTTKLITSYSGKLFGLF